MSQEQFMQAVHDYIVQNGKAIFGGEEVTMKKWN